MSVTSVGSLGKCHKQIDYVYSYGIVNGINGIEGLLMNVRTYDPNFLSPPPSFLTGGTEIRCRLGSYKKQPWANISSCSGRKETVTTRYIWWHRFYFVVDLILIVQEIEHSEASRMVEHPLRPCTSFARVRCGNHMTPNGISNFGFREVWIKTLRRSFSNFRTNRM